MCRPTPLPIAAVLLALVPGGACATLIDSFESGPFSMSLAIAGQSADFQNPDPNHCISSPRQIFLTYYAGSSSTMTSELIPFQNVDDAIVTAFPDGEADLDVSWSGGPWDITEGGTLNRISVRLTSTGDRPQLLVHLTDANGNSDTKSANITGSGNYHFAISSYAVDPARRTRMVSAYRLASTSAAWRTCRGPPGSSCFDSDRTRRAWSGTG